VIDERLQDRRRWYRICDAGWDDPLDDRFAAKRGGRWNPPRSRRKLYLNEDLVTARLNLDRFVAGWPYIPEGVAAVGLPGSYPIDGSVLLCTGSQRHYVVEVAVGKQMTEMLKGTLEGVVLALLSEHGPRTATRSPRGCGRQGFDDIAEGTVYALLVRLEQRGLVDVEKVPSEKGPPRKVYSLNDQGREHLDEFWRTWSFLAERLEQLRRGGR
jgi:PadR family transcriptional regulator, regulatory protein PadR